jgi:hypothetical protein
MILSATGLFALALASLHHLFNMYYLGRCSKPSSYIK